MLSRELSVDSKQFEYSLDSARSQTKFLRACQTVFLPKGERGVVLTVLCANGRAVPLV